LPRPAWIESEYEPTFREAALGYLRLLIADIESGSPEDVQLAALPASLGQAGHLAVPPVSFHGRGHVLRGPQL
jgi:hypothetical protein